jgi:hypothetical protein
MSKLLVDSWNIHPPWGLGAHDEHTWIIAAMAMSEEGKERIQKSLKKGDIYDLSDVSSDHASSDDDDENEAAIYYRRKAVFASEFTLKPHRNDPQNRYLYYTGFKVPDDVSIPLCDLVSRGLIPNLTMANLRMQGIASLEDPLPPYKSMEIMLQGKSVDKLSLSF